MDIKNKFRLKKYGGRIIFFFIFVLISIPGMREELKRYFENPAVISKYNKKIKEINGKYYIGGWRMNLHQKTQNKILSLIRKYHLYECEILAVETKTGKIIGYYNTLGEKLLPIASLFKTITISAYYRQYPDSTNPTISYRGLPQSTTKKEWRYGKIYKISLGKAFGKSNNSAFAYIGKMLGYRRIKREGEQFGFDKHLMGTLEGKIDSTDVMYLAPGLKCSYATSFFVLSFTNAIANNGILVLPYFLKKTGKRTIGRILPEYLAKKVINVSKYTTTIGTAAHSFKMVNFHLMAGGKTGSITGLHPKGRYDWFYGFAPLKNPEITVVVLIVNKEYWTTKSSYVGAEILKTYLKGRK